MHGDYFAIEGENFASNGGFFAFACDIFASPGDFSAVNGENLTSDGEFFAFYGEISA
jgi:hypothetical protein